MELVDCARIGHELCNCEIKRVCEEWLKTAAALKRSIFFARIFWIDNLLFQYMEAS